MDSAGAKVEAKACAVCGLRLKGKCVHYRGYTSVENMYSTGTTHEGKAFADRSYI